MSKSTPTETYEPQRQAYIEQARTWVETLRAEQERGELPSR